MRKGLPTKPLRTQKAGPVSRDVWFYATEAQSESPPSGESLSQILAADKKRLSNSPSPYARQQRPKNRRLRCMLCLRETNEWVTWDNSNEESSWQNFYDHLRSVHSITCRPLREPEVPQISGKHTSSEDEAQESDESPHPEPISKPKPSVSATAQSKPPQPQDRSLPAPSTSSRQDAQSVPKGRKGPVVEDNDEDKDEDDDEDEEEEEDQDDEDDTDRSEYPVRTTDEELDHVAAMASRGIINYTESDDEGALEDFRKARFGYRIPMNLKTQVKMLEIKMRRVTGERREAKAERDRVVAQRDKIAGERDRAIAERDREAKSRRLLKEEVSRLKEAARAREEELLKQSRLISKLKQDLRHASAQGGSSPSA